MEKEYNPIGLSAREIEICELISQGFLSKQIAQKLKIANATVDRHRYNISTKLKAKNIVDVINYTRNHLIKDSNG